MYDIILLPYREVWVGASDANSRVAVDSACIGNLFYSGYFQDVGP